MGVRFLPDRSPFLGGPVSGAAPTDADATLWAAAVVANGGTVSDGRLVVVRAFIAAEKAAGTWALTDDYWGLWAENAPQALTSLKQRRLATAVNAPVFGVDTGYVFDGVANYINTGFIPQSHALALTVTDMRIAGYERTNSLTTGWIAGTSDTTQRLIQLLPRDAANKYRGAANSTQTSSIATTTDSRGFTAFSRTSAPVFSFWKNGAFVETIAPANAALMPTRSLYIGCTNNAGTPGTFRASTVGMVSLGASLTAGQEAAQYANVQAWAAAVGAAIDPDVVPWAASVVTNGGTVSAARLDLVSSLVAKLKAAGTWDLIDDAWLLVAENVPQALTSLKQRRLAVSVAAPSFTIDRGYAFSGSAYIDTLFIPNTHKVAMTGTNMHIAAYERTNLAVFSMAAGSVNAASQSLLIVPRSNVNQMVVQLSNSVPGPGGDTISDSRGLSVGSRNGTLAADVLAYKNGVAILPLAAGVPGSSLPTVKLFIGAQCNVSSVAVGFRAATEGFVSVGAAIPAGQQPAFYNAIQAHMTAVGANV